MAAQARYVPPLQLVHDATARLQRCAALEAYWARLLETWGQPAAAIVWIGVGSPSASASARIQLALGLALRAHARATACTLEAFDPSFTTADRTLLAALDVRVLTKNRAGAHVAERPTIFIMPHCVRTLYDRVLWANAPHLERVCVIGNSLRHMAEPVAGGPAHPFAHLQLVSALAPF